MLETYEAGLSEPSFEVWNAAALEFNALLVLIMLLKLVSEVPIVLTVFDIS